MRTDVPAASLAFGFVNEPVGTHTSRTLMLPELNAVLAAATPEADAVVLRTTAVTENAVGKPSAAGRAKTFRHLREFYAMDPAVEVFRALRTAWYGAEDEHALLALLCAAARDPVLRATASVINRIGFGDQLEKPALKQEVQDDFPAHYSTGVLARIGRNLASSWTQSGHLVGRTKKRRVQARSGPVSLAYALYLGHLTGASGKQLFDTVWTSVLDRSSAELELLAERASRQGWIDYRASGGMVEVTFRHLQAATES